MLEALNAIIRQAPVHTTSVWAGFPINCEFREVMCTESGRVAFLNENVNVHFKKILNEWSSFLPIQLQQPQIVVSTSRTV